MPAISPTARISSTRHLLSSGGESLALRRLWVEIGFENRVGLRRFSRCLLDTGAAVCVIPFMAQRNHSLLWQPLPGTWPPGMTTWMGVPCVLGEIQVWPVLTDPPYLQGPLRMIAKFPVATPHGVQSSIPIILGLNFLADYLAQTSFQCHSLPTAGVIELP